MLIHIIMYICFIFCFFFIFLVTNIIFLFLTYIKIFSLNTNFFVSNSKTYWLFKLIQVWINVILQH